MDEENLNFKIKIIDKSGSPNNNSGIGGLNLDEDFSNIQYMEDEDLFVNTLFRYNQTFILNKITQLISDNQYSTFEILKSSCDSSSSRSICGKVWKGNSHIYKCLDCQIDENCAICVDCFEEDKHIGHRYRLIPSSNGCCDCGDLSAWKKEGCCSVHVKKEVSNSDSEKLLPKNTKKIILELIFKKLLKEITKSSYSKQEEITVDVLNKFIDIFGDPLSILLGSYVVSISDQNNKQSILRSLCILASKPDSNLEKFIISLFICSEFRDMLALSMAEAFDDDSFDSSLTVQLFTVESTALKIVSKNKFKHIVNCLYKSIYTSRIGYNSNNNKTTTTTTATATATATTTTTTTEANQLNNNQENELQDENLEQILTNDSIQTNPYEPYLQIDDKSKVLKQTNYFKSLTSISYIVKTNSSFLWLIKNPKLILKCLDILALTEGMNPNTRLTDSHIEFEDLSWKTMLSLEIFLQRFLTRSIFKQMQDNSKLISESEAIEIRDHIIKRIIQFYQASSTNDNSNKWKKGIRDQVIPEYCISKQPVSIHVPLHRALFRILYFQSLYFNRSPREVLKSISSSPNFESIIIEHILRVLVLTYQCKAGLWVRNGDSILNQIANYNFSPSEFDSTDIYLLQYILLSMDTKQFYAQILDRSELSSWFQLDDSNNINNDNNKSLFSSISNKIFNNDNNNNNQNNNNQNIHPLLNHLLNNNQNNNKSESDRSNILMAERFLDSIIWIVNDRKKLSNLSGNQLLRKELVHILAVKPQTYSEVYPRVSEEYEESIELDKILNEISIYQSATTTEAGKFRLKAEVWNEWNYFYPHYLKNEQQKSEECFQAHCRKEKIENIYSKPLVKLEEPLDIFKGIETLLHSEILHSIIFTIIYNNLVGSNKTSDTLLTSSLYLLYLSFETYNDNQINKQKKEKDQQNSQIRKQQQKSQLKYSNLNSIINNIIPNNLNQRNTSLSPSVSKSHSIPKSSSPPKSPSLSFFSSPFTSKSLSPPKSSPPKSMISAYQSNVSTPIKIATSLGLVSSPSNKSNDSSKHLDIGFTSDDILKNFAQQIKIGSNSSSSGSNNNSINLVSMLTHMNNLSKFEIHHPTISKILNHPITKSNINSDNNDKSSDNNINNENDNLSKSPNIDSNSNQMKEMAKKKQMEMMKLMKEQQSKFFKNNELNAYYYDDGLDDEDQDQDNQENDDDDDSDDEYFSDPNNDEFLDKNELFYFEKDEPLIDLGNCVICRDELCVNSNYSSGNSSSNNKSTNNKIGYIGALHKHSLLSYTSLLSMDPNISEERRRIDQIYHNKNSNINMEAPLTIDMYDTDGPFINFCSHLIHINCLDSLIDGHNNNNAWRRDLIRLQEFQCPVCRGKSNIVAPYSKKRISTIKLNHYLKRQKLKHQQELIVSPPIEEETKEEFTKKEFNNWLTSILDSNNFLDLPKIDKIDILQQQDKYDSFTRAIYINSMISKSVNDQIQHLYNIMNSCISVYELSKRNSQFDFNNFKLIRKPFNNLIKLCIEQSTNNIVQRKYDIQQLFKILSNNSNTAKFMKLDMFGLFIRFYLSNESLITFRASNSNDIKFPNSPISFLISLFFIGTLLQSIIYFYKFNNINSIIEFLNNNNNNLNNLDIEIKRICLVYLRKVCFFLICLDTNIDTLEYNQRESTEIEFESLLKLIKNSSGVELSIESLLFNNSTLNKVITQYWLSNEYLDVAYPYQLQLPLRTWKPFSIKTELPLDYLKYFLENTTKKTCSECEGKNGQVKFMCLLCDKRLCSKDFILHANEDLDIHPIGCYLLLNETAIIVTHLKKTKIWGTVYLDQHGAEDYGLRRGKPLTLNRDRLNKLNDDIINLNIISLQNININR